MKDEAVNDLADETELLRKDAERYRWLRLCDFTQYQKIADDIGGTLPSGDTLDRRIDAARLLQRLDQNVWRASNEEMW